jgi:FAD/FMN-containing dehydrogenase
MKTIAVDSSSRTVRADPGVVAHELVAGTSLHELVPVLGQCATVGISGLTLGGGLGWLSGKYGATCDNLLSAELISADGESLVANSTENSDLFWAIRGGGGNFGVVTSFEYRLHPLRAVLAGVLTYSLADAPAMLRFYRDFMAEAPDELQAVARLAWDGDPVLNVVVCFSGHPNDGEQIIRPLRTRLTPVRDTMRSRAYSGTFTGALLTEAALETSAGPKAFQHIKGCYLESLSDDAIDVVLDRLAHAPGPGAMIGLDHYMHGAVCRVARDSTAFELRQPGALHIWIVSGWSDPAITAAMVAWSEETWNALQSYSGGRVYANYPNAEGESAARAVYGGNYSRLLEIKKKYDPSNVFQQNQNLRPTLG